MAWMACAENSGIRDAGTNNFLAVSLICRWRCGERLGKAMGDCPGCLGLLRADHCGKRAAARRFGGQTTSNHFEPIRTQIPISVS